MVFHKYLNEYHSIEKEKIDAKLFNTNNVSP